MEYRVSLTSVDKFPDELLAEAVDRLHTQAEQDTRFNTTGVGTVDGKARLCVWLDANGAAEALFIAQTAQLDSWVFNEWEVVACP